MKSTNSKENLFYPALLIMISTVIFAINWSFGKFFGWQDIGFYELNPLESVFRNLFVWHDYRGFGMVFMGNGNIVRAIMVVILDGIFSDAYVVNLFYNYFLFILPGISAYFLGWVLSREYIKSSGKHHKYGFLVALFYQLNLGNFISNSHPLFSQEWSSFSLPLLFGSVLLYIKDSRYIYLLVFSCIMSIGTFSHVGYSIPFYVSLFLLVLSNCEFKKNLRKYFRTIVVFLLINGASIYSTGLFALKSSNGYSDVSNNYTESVLNVLKSGSNNSSLLNSFQMIGSVNWGETSPWYKDSTKYPYSEFFDLPFIKYFTLIFPTLIVLGLVAVRGKGISSGEQKLYLSLSIIYIILLFFLKTTSPPFGTFFEGIITSFRPLQLFRTPYSKIVLVISLVSAILCAFYILRIEKNEFVSKILVLIIVLSYTLPVIYYKGLFQKVGFFDFPKELIEVADVVNRDRSTSRVIMIPRNPRTSRYSYGYYGGDIGRNYFNKSLIDYSYVGPDRISGDYAWSVLKPVDSDSLFISDNVLDVYELEEWLKTLCASNVEYVIIDRTYLGSYSLSSYPSHNSKLNTLVEYLTNSDTVTFIDSYNSSYYIFKLNSVYPRLHINDTSTNGGKNVKFEKINATTYLLSLYNLRSQEDLIFLEAYDSMWEIREYPYEQSFECGEYRDSPSFGVTECIPVNEHYFSKVFLNWGRKISSLEHGIYKGVFNRWTLDPELLKNSLDDGSFTINEDGSLNATFVLHYKPQIVFYVLFMISLLTLSVFTVALIINTIRYINNVWKIKSPRL